VQVVELKVPKDAGVSEKVMVPVGVIAVPEFVSVTLAIHVVAWFTAAEDGEQVTDANVLRCVAVRENVPELPVWSKSLPYEPAINIEPSFPGDGV
jgi:hypothetical protein